MRSRGSMTTARKTTLMALLSAGVKLCNLPRNMRQYASKMTLAAIVLAVGVTTAAAQDSIKVGVIQPLTGAFAASGNYVANGAKIAADEINAKGGVLGKKLELVIEDNKSNPTEAAAVAEKLIVRDKVPVMMGAWGSGFTLAIMPKL